MSALYAVSQCFNGRVANTCNLSEDYVGYATRYGDGAGDFARLENFIRARDEHALLYGVRGNCDFCAHDVPDMRVMPLGGANVFMTHGHLYRAKSTYTYLDEAAYERGCTVTLFGHTHSPCVETRRTLMINPGSAADGRLALLELNDGRPRVNLLSY